jgi:hypothetical protein
MVLKEGPKEKRIEKDEGKDIKKGAPTNQDSNKRFDFFSFLCLCWIVISPGVSIFSFGGETTRV